MVVLKGLNRLHGRASLTALSEEVGESPAKVHRYLASLISEGLVVQDETTQRYVLGPEALQIGLTAMRLCDPVRAAEPSLVRLRERLQVSCFASILGNLGPTILRMEEPGLPVTVNVRAGSVMPLLWSATGRAFFGFTADQSLQAQAERELAEASERQRATLAADQPLEALRAEVRAAGCAAIDGVLVPGISAVAAPIFDFKGQVVAVLTALGASGGFDVTATSPIVAAVREEAERVSAGMGWRAATPPTT
jgi:DNA-binding IclR family transcriptional regulator